MQQAGKPVAALRQQWWVDGRLRGKSRLAHYLTGLGLSHRRRWRSWLASASAFLENGRTVGVNMGAGFGDASAPDNAIILDGRIHKLDDVGFEYEPRDLVRPWRMRSRDGRLRLEFVPFKERVARSNLLLVKSEIHQIFGHYSGAFTTDEGQAVALRDVTGFVEQHRARW